MDIFKATFFNNCGHRIEPIECINLTFSAVVIARSQEEMEKHNTNKPIIFERESHNARYCSTKQEAVNFLDKKYQNKIEDIQGNLFDHKQQQKKLLELL